MTGFDEVWRRISDAARRDFLPEARPASTAVSRMRSEANPVPNV
jgi:hypothetical protein